MLVLVLVRLWRMGRRVRWGLELRWWLRLMLRRWWVLGWRLELRLRLRLVGGRQRGMQGTLQAGLRVRRQEGLSWARQEGLSGRDEGPRGGGAGLAVVEEPHRAWWLQSRPHRPFPGKHRLLALLVECRAGLREG